MFLNLFGYGYPLTSGSSFLSFSWLILSLAYAPSLQQKVFVKFYKEDAARTRSYGGSGIGLSIVEAIQKSHHQDYGVYNAEDGVVFYYELDSGETKTNAM